MPHIPSHLRAESFLPEFGTTGNTDFVVGGGDPADFATEIGFNPLESAFGDFFETDALGRQAQFQARLPQAQTAGQQRFNPFAFEQLMNSFLRRLGMQFNAGVTPNATFGGELASQFSTPGQQQRLRARAPVFQSGLGTAGLVGPLRRLFSQ